MRCARIPPLSDTRELLSRWHGGDQDALAILVQQDLPWIEVHVRRRLGPALRRRADTQDMVQNTLVEVLRYGPRFVVSNRGHLRALLARMIENVLRVQANHHGAQKRDVRREVNSAPVPSVGAPSGDSVPCLDPPSDATAPGAALERSELREWVRLALEFLDPDDRRAVVWRDFDGLAFAEIAGRLGVTEDAARMRYRRALPKLAQSLKKLRCGDLAELL